MDKVKNILICVLIGCMLLTLSNVNKVVKNISNLYNQTEQMYQFVQTIINDVKNNIDSTMDEINTVKNSFNDIKVELINFKGDFKKSFTISIDSLNQSLNRMEAYVKNTFEYIEVLKEKTKLPIPNIPSTTKKGK